MEAARKANAEVDAWDALGLPLLAIPVADCAHCSTHVLVAFRVGGGQIHRRLLCRRRQTLSVCLALNQLPLHRLGHDVPIIESTRERCQRCGARSAELHHWAPRAWFEDADDWPTAYLCRTCHLNWH